MGSRPATETDVARVTETITLAFETDPVWGVALAAPDGSITHLPAYWRCFVESALRYSSVFVDDDLAAVSVWIPPGGAELDDAHEVAVRGQAESVLSPDRASALFALWDRFEDNHPRVEPHAYLSLLATHPDHRGRGVGQRLLAEDLARWDRSGTPCYLESTNPDNDHRYERAGFRRIGGFTSIVDSAPISTMWRDA